MKITHALALRTVSLLFIAACGGPGTSVDAGTLPAGSFALVQLDGAPLPIALRRIVGASPTTPSCTDYLTAMTIDVTASGGATTRESTRLACDAGVGDATSSLTESGTASKTGDEWRFDFTRTDIAVTTHYFGRMDGTNLTIVRRETDATTTGQVSIPATVSLSQLVFQRG